MEKITYINLMTDGHQIPPCSHEYGHSWQRTIKPSGNQSGWSEEKCIHCGVTIGYDTSD